MFERGETAEEKTLHLRFSQSDTDITERTGEEGRKEGMREEGEEEERGEERVLKRDRGREERLVEKGEEVQPLISIISGEPCGTGFKHATATTSESCPPAPRLNEWQLNTAARTSPDTLDATLTASRRWSRSIRCDRKICCFCLSQYDP